MKQNHFLGKWMKIFTKDRLFVNIFSLLFLKNMVL